MKMKIKVKSIINDLDITPLLRFLLQRNSPISSSYLFLFFFHFFFHPPQMLAFINLPIFLPPFSILFQFI